MRSALYRFRMLSIVALGALIFVFGVTAQTKKPQDDRKKNPSQSETEKTEQQDTIKVDTDVVTVPVIASDLRALREVGADHVRYVTPGDIEALREAMNELQEAPSSVRDVAARQMHAATFDWGRCARESMKVYETVVGRCSTRTRDKVRHIL